MRFLLKTFLIKCSSKSFFFFQAVTMDTREILIPNNGMVYFGYYYVAKNSKVIVDRFQDKTVQLNNHVGNLLFFTILI